MMPTARTLAMVKGWLCNGCNKIVINIAARTQTALFQQHHGQPGGGFGRIIPCVNSGSRLTGDRRWELATIINAGAGHGIINNKIAFYACYPMYINTQRENCEPSLG
jgi:hypothetical protein